MSKSFFELGRCERTGRSTFIDPSERPFLSIGLNHADESNLHYPDNQVIWQRKYGSRARWIKEGVVKDLGAFGFNTLGWTQEYVAGDWGEALDWQGDPIDLIHSQQPWTAEELQSAGIPYVVQLRVMPIEDWNGEPVFQDVFSEKFEKWCEYLARSMCTPHRESRNLLGYYFVDIPAWIRHASRRDFPQLASLGKEEREIEVEMVAEKYYQTITQAIKMYDPNHLILGDRYNGNKGIPRGVLRAMSRHVDVLSVQYFVPEPTDSARQKMRDDLAKWSAESGGKPVLLADIGNYCATKENPHRKSAIDGQRGRGEDYVETLKLLVNEPWFVGWHWCSYIENLARGWGLKDHFDEPYTEMTSRISAFNKETQESWATRGVDSVTGLAAS